MLSHRVAGPRELPKAASSRLALQPAAQTAEIQFRHCFAYKVYQLQCTAKVQLLLYICTLDFKSIFKLVDILSSLAGRERPCQYRHVRTVYGIPSSCVRQYILVRTGTFKKPEARRPQLCGTVLSGDRYVLARTYRTGSTVTS